MRKELRATSLALGDATLSRLPDFNRFVGEYDLKEVKDIQLGDVIIQFGVKNSVIRVITPKRFSIFPSKRKFTVVIKGSTGEVHNWKNLNGSDRFRVLLETAD